ncbi:MAG: L-lactate dehydrogenase [Selenomonas sp.]|uniref:L-lactate dehydrogenase n=1 Tax=Selenomonas sp. TaxID=2053611 RepID=UPI0025D1DC41|nr:L-lactate dehydrogenase [Selenomonas sp.]MCR5756358.1 L-lactate dehydrogenase [Selenomonas sp.]
MFKPHKLAIIGLGHVGSAVLARAIACQLAADIACIDIKPEVAHGEALDAVHSMSCSYVPGIHVHSGGFEECRDADVIICDAGPSILPGQKLDRLTLAKENIGVIREVMREVTKYTRESVFIMITNPLDITTYVAATEFDYPLGRLFGTGTTLETMRLKSIIGRHYHVDAADVQGYMLGEHGNSAFPAWSTVNIGGVPLARLDEFYDHDKDLDRQDIAQEVVNTAYDVLQSKGWTNTGIAMGACRLAKAVLFDERAVLPVSMPFAGEYGLKDVALSLPSIIGRHGVEKRIALNLPADELELMQKSAESVKSVMRANKVID